jgi:hypothetical protein
MVERAINMDIDWICLKEPTFFGVMTALYPHATVVMRKEGVVLSKVSVMMCSQWLPPKTHAIWMNPEFKLVLSQVANPILKSLTDWKSFPLCIRHQEMGGITVTEVLLHVLSRGRFTPESVKHHSPRMVSSCCKDYNFGREVDSQQSRRALKPDVVRVAEGIYHESGIYPLALKEPPQCVLRSRNASYRWCKRRMHQGEVLTMLDVSGTIFVAMTEELRAKLLTVPNLAPVKVLFAAALAVIK